MQPLSKSAVMRLLDTRARRERIHAARLAAVLRRQLDEMRGTYPAVIARRAA